jgi:hypothetical protein
MRSAVGRRNRLRSASLAMLVIVSTHCATGLGEEEVECQEAVAHLMHCCPGLTVQPNACDYSGEACSGGTVPAFSATTSRCIRAKSCAQLADDGLCFATRGLAPVKPGDDAVGCQ